MTRSPAFQFYPGDFVSGAPAFMKPLETHVYVWLLCLEWSRDGFEYNESDLAAWCRISVTQFRSAWERVGPNFTERAGRYFNRRLDAERDKQRQYSERMAENGRKGGRRKADDKPGESRGLADDVRGEEPRPSIVVSSSISSSLQQQPAASPRVQAVLDFYIATHPRRRIGPKDRKAVTAALALGYEPSDLANAIAGNASDPWHREKHKHELPYVLRDTGKIDDFRAKHDAASREPGLCVIDGEMSPELERATRPKSA